MLLLAVFFAIVSLKNILETGTNIDRISVNPQIHFGKPCIADTCITVQSVLELLSEGVSFDAVIQDYYPDLQVEDIRICLRYAVGSG